VVVEIGGRAMWGGLLWTATYQSQAKIMELYAKTLDQYPTKRLVEVDRTWTATDARQIFLDLYTMMQADPNSVDVALPSSPFSGLEMDFSVTASDRGTYRTALDSVANTITGFEWTIDWTRIGNSYARTMRIGIPLGQAPGDYDIVFEYPGNILNYWRNDTMGAAGTNIVGIGAGEGNDMNVVEVVHSDLLNNGFPRYDQTVSLKDIDNLDLLEALTRKQADLAKAPSPVYTVEMKADREPMFGDWGIGDACRLVMLDPRHPNGMNFQTRIIGWEYYPKSSDQVSEVRVTFEGDSDAE